MLLNALHRRPRPPPRYRESKTRFRLESSCPRRRQHSTTTQDVRGSKDSNLCSGRAVADTLPSLRFEKSLYDLIRGLRNHKGNEREYIQESLRECRKEIKGSDMGEF